MDAFQGCVLKLDLISSNMKCLELIEITVSNEATLHLIRGLMWFINNGHFLSSRLFFIRGFLSFLFFSNKSCMKKYTITLEVNSHKIFDFSILYHFYCSIHTIIYIQNMICRCAFYTEIEVKK